MQSKIKGLLLAFLPFLVIGFYPALLKAESLKAKSASWDTRASVVLVGDRDDHGRHGGGRWDRGNRWGWDRDRDWRRGNRWGWDRDRDWRRRDWDDRRWKHHDRDYYYGNRRGYYYPSYNYYYSYPYSYGYSPYGYSPYGYNYPYYGGNSGFGFLGGLLRLW